jgi:general secretion pathway protein K
VTRRPGARLRTGGEARRRAHDGGFALVAVLLVLALLGIIGAEFAYSMRLEASAARAWKEAVLAAHLAEAAVEQAVREIVGEGAYVAPGEDGELTFYARDGRRLPRLPRARVPLGAGEYSYRLSDEEGRLNLNTAPPDRLDRLLQALGLPKVERDTIVDSLLDWRDANEEHRLNGAESDYYLRLPVPYRARNGNLESVRELLQIKGVTPALFHGREGTPALVDLVTVKTPGQVNLNTAPPAVLAAYGLADAEITDILQTRQATPYVAVPGRFAGRGLAAGTRTFRVEAEGLVNGQVRARVTAIVQRRSEGTAQPVVVLEWTPHQ